MKLTYQVGIATLIQLGIMSLLNIANGVVSAGQQCVQNSSDCPGDIITSLLYFMVITIWFTFLWILSAAAQERRSRKLAFIVIGGEFLVFAVALFNTHSNIHNNILGFITSIIDAALAAWVILLGIRLFIAGGSRVTSSARSRRRRLSGEPTSIHKP